MKEYFKGFTLAPDYKEAIIKRQPISRSIFIDPTINALGMMIANNTQAYWLDHGAHEPTGIRRCPRHRRGKI